MPATDTEAKPRIRFDDLWLQSDLQLLELVMETRCAPEQWIHARFPMQWIADMRRVRPDVGVQKHWTTRAAALRTKWRLPGWDGAAPQPRPYPPRTTETYLPIIRTAWGFVALETYETLAAGGDVAEKWIFLSFHAQDLLSERNGVCRHGFTVSHMMKEIAHWMRPLHPGQPVGAVPAYGIDVSHNLEEAYVLFCATLCFVGKSTDAVIEAAWSTLEKLLRRVLVDGALERALWRLNHPDWRAVYQTVAPLSLPESWE